MQNKIYGSRQHEGLYVLTRNAIDLKIYTKANGLLTDQFNYNSGFKDSTGTMYFGSVKGMISFNPNTFGENHFTAPVYITQIEVNNKPLIENAADSILKTSILFTNSIDLKYNQSSLSIDFAALSFTSPEMTDYVYKMEGLDESWTYISANRKIYYTNLSPGNYTFKVKAGNNGKWVGKTTILHIYISPPFWLSTAAFLLYILIFAAITYFIVSNYLNRMAEKNKRKIELVHHEKEKEIYEAKIEFFTNVAHEIRTPLTLIKAPLEKVVKKEGNNPNIAMHLKSMERNTNRLIELTNQLLDFRKTETKGFSLNFTDTDVTELLLDHFSNFKPVAEQKKLQYTINLPTRHAFACADAEALNKIFSNLIDNSLKYATKKIHVQLMPFDKTDKELIIEISNDGYLVPLEMQEKIFEPFFRIKATESRYGNGIGLALSRSLAELQKGKIYMKHTDTNMNTFVFTLPVEHIQA